MSMSNQYLQSLEQELRDVPEPLRREWLADYAEHFRIAMENGQPEADICQELGDPRVIARELRMNNRFEQAQKNGSLMQLMRALLVGTSLGVFNLLFILAPFLGVAAAIIAMWAVDGMLLLIPLYFVWESVFGELYSGLSGLAMALIAIGLGLVLLVIMKVLTRWFVRGTIRYLQANRKLLQEGSSRA